MGYKVLKVDDELCGLLEKCVTNAEMLVEVAHTGQKNGCSLGKTHMALMQIQEKGKY